MKITISIITVTFNNEDHISAYLKSILSYLDQDIELIIIDNNSTDKTVEIVKKNK